MKGGERDKISCELLSAPQSGRGVSSLAGETPRHGRCKARRRRHPCFQWGGEHSFRPAGIAGLPVIKFKFSPKQEGFRNIRPACEYAPLYHAALCRMQADWLVGINATRLFSPRYHRLLNIGWVMTPTLTLLLEREAQIRAFHSTPFYTVQLDCGTLTAASESRNSDSWIY